MSVSEKAKTRMLKLLALARRGEGGERAKAQNLLDRMLREHGLSVADLERDDLPRSHREFPYRGDFEKRLLNQIAGQVLNTNRPTRWGRKGESRAIFDLNDLEYLEMKLRWAAYRPALKREQERLFQAFVQAQRIFPDSPTGGERDELSAEDQAEVFRVLQMAQGVTHVPIRRALPGGAE